VRPARALGEDLVNAWPELPLFPLRTVLFPGMVLPLHVFEERYKLMINRCLEESRPFGVVLIHEGQEVGGEALPYGVGTTAIIAGISRLEGGRMNVVAVGGERFRLGAVRRDLPYLVGTAESWPLTGAETDQARDAVRPVRALLREYLDLVMQAQGEAIELGEIPTEPLSLALLVAVALQLPMSQKQELLVQASVADLLLAERTILRRERLILDEILRTQEHQWEGGYSGLLAKN
jgi:uncharacterized protein